MLEQADAVDDGVVGYESFHLAFRRIVRRIVLAMPRAMTRAQRSAR